MQAARDAEDVRLLAAGDHATLLATYLPVVQARVYARVRGAGGDDVVQEIMLRLVRELSAGKAYPVPYRVVVHQVVGWLIKAHFQGERISLVQLPEDWDPVGEDGIAIEDTVELVRLFEGLTGAEREAVELRYLEGREITEIAEELGIERNAVDQVLFRARKKIRVKLDA